MTPRRIALFGGSFDPVHLGHLEIARRAKEEARLDEVRFLPCRLSPHKLGRPPAPARHRVAMLEITLAGKPWALIDDFELRAEEPSYSHRTVAHFRAGFPDARLFWIVGGDQWRTLPTWKNPEYLAENLEFLAFARRESPRPRPGWRMRAVAGEHPASSSAIRDALARGDEPHDLLPPGVPEYIRRHGLYRQ